ncbi:MAG: hypothetical protein NTZ90_05360 [Proteobacteria bacterium]|nr:hypothetical protein [Pseudomonadota bacterium]
MLVGFFFGCFERRKNFLVCGCVVLIDKDFDLASIKAASMIGGLQMRRFMDRCHFRCPELM